MKSMKFMKFMQSARSVRSVKSMKSVKGFVGLSWLYKFELADEMQRLRFGLISLGTRIASNIFYSLDYLIFKISGRRVMPQGALSRIGIFARQERGDVPGWVLVVLMTTGLVTAIWAIAAPKLNAILKNSLDSMSNIR